MRINDDMVAGTLDAVESGTTYQFRKEGRDADYLLQIHTYNNSLSGGTYHLEVAPVGTTAFTQICNTDGSVIQWTDQGVVFVFNPGASCDVRLRMSAYSSGSIDYTIRLG